MIGGGLPEAVVVIQVDLVTNEPAECQLLLDQLALFLGFQTGKYVYCSRSHGNQRFQGGPELAVAFFVLLDVKGYFDLPRLQFARLFFIGT